MRFTPTKETVGECKIEDCNGKNKVWTKSGNTLKAHAVQIGMSDGTHTEILKGIANGTEIVTGVDETTDEALTEMPQEQSPFAPGPPKKDKKK